MTQLLRHDVRPPRDWEIGPLGLYVPPRAKRVYDRPVAVDLFCGAGGMGCGFHQAGFHVAAASEYDIDAACTYMVNLARPGVRIHFDTDERAAKTEDRLARRLLGGRPTTTTASGLVVDGVAGSGWISGQPPDHPGCEHFFLYDIKNLTGELVLDALGLEPGEVTAVTGGPPCQGFSQSGKRDVMDPRNSLIFEFARLVCEIQPMTFVMENVVGLASMVTPEGIPVLDAFCLAVSEGGYGDYDALRKSIAGTEAKVGVRNPRPRPTAKARAAEVAKKKPAVVAEDEDDQLDLFSGAS